MRTFISIAIPEKVRIMAKETKERLAASNSDVKWVDPKNYHLTIKFLGDVGDETINQIKDKAHNVSETCPPFELNTTGMGFFPNRIRPRVIWLGIGGELEKAAFLCDRVDNYLYELGFEPERQHRFHLTLGRLRSETGVENMLKIAASINFKPVMFKVNEFHLMESVLMPTGPIYKNIDSFTLKG